MLRLVLAASLAALPAAAQVAAPAAYVYPFAVAGDTSAMPSAACATGATAVKTGVTDSSAAQLAASVTFALQQQLTATGAVSLLPPGTPLPPGAITFSGCLTRLEAGSKGKRVLVGMGSGGSFLGAHVVIAQGGRTLRDFDLEVKGSNAAPPIFGGALYNMAHLSKTSLEADAPKLAEKVVAQFRASTPGPQPQPAAARAAESFGPSASPGKLPNTPASKPADSTPW